MDSATVSLLDNIVKAQKKAQKAQNLDVAKANAAKRSSVAPTSRKYYYFISSFLMLSLFAYVMAYFVMDDSMRYERGVGRTIPRIKVAVGILSVYVPFLAVYIFSTGSETDSDDLDFMTDIAHTVALVVLLNFVLTTAAYVLTWYWTYIDYSEPDENFNMKDVVDMRKVRMSVKHSNPCSMAQFEGRNEFALRDYGTLQTIPLGTGTQPTENIAGKLSWLLDVTFSARNKEELVFDDSWTGWAWWGVSGFFGTVFAPFKFILQQFPILNGLLALGPTVILAFMVFYLPQIKMLSGESGLAGHFGGPLVAGILLKLVKFAVFMFLGFMMTSATTGSDVISTITDIKGASCFGGIIAKFISTFLFAMPDRIFKTAIQSSSPPPNVFPDFSYYSGTMDFLRDNGFCTPYAWRTYLKYVWSKGELPKPLDDDDKMDELIDEMERSPMAWPSTVARTALMHAYNKKKFFDNFSSKKEWLNAGRKSVVLRHLNDFAPFYRKQEVLTVLSPDFYKDPYNFRSFSKEDETPEDSAYRQREFMRWRREYVRNTMEKALDMFSYDNVRTHFVDFKKLGLDSSQLLTGYIAKSGPYNDIVDPLYVERALWAFDKDDENDKETQEEYRAGQHRMDSIIPFLSSTGSRSNMRLGIDGYNGLTSGYCESVFPGPPALIEDRQYRLNGYNGLFTLLPVWEGSNKYGSQTTYDYVTGFKWLGWPDIFLNNLEWDSRSGALRPKPGYGN